MYIQEQMLEKEVTIRYLLWLMEMLNLRKKQVKNSLVFIQQHNKF